MGKKAGWFYSVKKALGHESKKQKSKKKWFAKHQKNPASADIVCIEENSDDVHVISPSSPPPQSIDQEPKAVTTHSPIRSAQSIDQEPKLYSPPPRPTEYAAKEEKAPQSNIDHRQQKEDAYSLALAAAKAAAMAAQAAAEVVRLTSPPHYAPNHDSATNDGITKEEIAAIKIQTVFRGYLARRALRALRGLMRLKSLIEGQTVKRQSVTTLRSMQSMSRLQNQVHAKRIRMSEENQALQRQLQIKHEKELEEQDAKLGGDWDDSRESKQKVEEKLQNKQEAAVRREKALAYAYSRQQMWRMKNAKSTATKQTSGQVDQQQAMSDPNNINNNPYYWGWNWLERWMAGRPWETRSLNQIEKDYHLNHDDFISIKAAIMSRNLSVSGDNSSSSSSPTKGKGRSVLPPTPRHSLINTSKIPSKMNSICPPAADRKVGGKDKLEFDRRRHSIACSSTVRT